MKSASVAANPSSVAPSPASPRSTAFSARNAWFSARSSKSSLDDITPGLSSCFACALLRNAGAMVDAAETSLALPVYGRRSRPPGTESIATRARLHGSAFTRMDGLTDRRGRRAGPTSANEEFPRRRACRPVRELPLADRGILASSRTQYGSRN